jgi:hypothetical protein
MTKQHDLRLQKETLRTLSGRKLDVQTALRPLATPDMQAVNGGIDPSSAISRAVSQFSEAVSEIVSEIWSAITNSEVSAPLSLPDSTPPQSMSVVSTPVVSPPVMSTPEPGSMGGDLVPRSF